MNTHIIIGKTNFYESISKIAEEIYNNLKDEKLKAKFSKDLAVYKKEASKSTYMSEYEFLDKINKIPIKCYIAVFDYSKDKMIAFIDIPTGNKEDEKECGIIIKEYPKNLTETLNSMRHICYYLNVEIDVNKAKTVDDLINSIADSEILNRILSESLKQKTSIDAFKKFLSYAKKDYDVNLITGDNRKFYEVKEL